MGLIIQTAPSTFDMMDSYNNVIFVDLSKLRWVIFKHVCNVCVDTIQPCSTLVAAMCTVRCP